MFIGAIIVIAVVPESLGRAAAIGDRMLHSPLSSDQGAPLLGLHGISKSYGHVHALIDVDFSIGRHEVVGLLGDNGAGKSTLVRIISGVERPDKGRFISEGREVKIQSRRDSEACGVETIYQDIALAGPMSITRNIFAGREPTTYFGFLRLKEMRRTAVEVLKHAVDIAGINSPDLAVNPYQAASSRRWQSRGRFTSRTECCCSMSRQAPFRCARRRTCFNTC